MSGVLLTRVPRYTCWMVRLKLAAGRERAKTMEYLASAKESCELVDGRPTQNNMVAPPDSRHSDEGSRNKVEAANQIKDRQTASKNPW